jgi:lysophospholipase L1-like esterase
VKFRIITQSFLSIALTLSLVAARAQCQNSQSGALNTAAGRPLNILVLGDSIMWGQGLRSENKSWHQIKVWLAQQTGRPVIERIEAHSGAVVEADSREASNGPVDGEVNVARPSLVDQLERALRYYVHGREVDLVLVSGCVNDLGARYVLNAANTTDEIRLLTEAKCGPLMEKLLRRITSSFPSAYVIVAGYYPFVSEKTRNDIFMRGVTKRFYKAIPGAAKMNQEVLFKRMVANSDQWYRSSNKSLDQAVKNVNAEVSRRNAHGRVMFAEIHLLPEHSFRARKTQLWDFESSLVRKLLVVLSFGRILLRTNDEVRKQRASSCKEFWKAPPSETSSQKKERKNEELLCRYAALGHPNRQGALVYAEAIVEQLKSRFPVLGTK